MVPFLLNSLIKRVIIVARIAKAKLAIGEENLASANSRIRDTDFAEEVSEMTKSNILMQAGISVLGQANNANSSAL